MATTDTNVNLAVYAEHAERYDEMKDFMAARVQTGVALSPDEREIFSAAFKNALSSRRNAVRVAVGFEENYPAPYSSLAAGYRSKVSAELAEVCNGCIQMISAYLLKEGQDAEANVFYLKMLGDYYRYMAEFSEESEKRESLKAQASQNYYNGFLRAQELPTTHPTRLGLALNYSVFLHEVAKDTAQAINTAQSALASAINEISAGIVDEKTKEDAMLTLQLLKENLDLWGGAA